MLGFDSQSHILWLLSLASMLRRVPDAVAIAATARISKEAGEAFVCHDFDDADDFEDDERAEENLAKDDVTKEGDVFISDVAAW